MPNEWGDFLKMDEQKVDRTYMSNLLLAENPQWAYFSAEPFTTTGQTGFSPAQQQYWRGQSGDIWNRYLGELGTAARQGTDFGTFSDYLTDMPFTEMYYQNVSPRQRAGIGRFSPTTQYMY